MISNESIRTKALNYIFWLAVVILFSITVIRACTIVEIGQCHEYKKNAELCVKDILGVGGEDE